MPPNRTISNFIITMVILFFMFITGLLLKARYRLPSERKAAEAARLAEQKPEPAVPKAVPVGQRIYEPRSYKSGAFWVLSHPQLVETRSNDADTLRIRSGPREDVFVLYGVDAAQVTWTHPRRIAGQAAYFGGLSPPKVLAAGAQALAWVTQLLSSHPFIVYTKWTRVPETERYYAFVRVQVDGKQQDLGELLVKNGFAAPNGPAPDAVPEVGRTPEDYHRTLQKGLSLAKAMGAGVWGQ
jgi:endonuclease YncB( thermonuclease family)